MNPIRNDPNCSRPQWEIDRQLARFVGCHIRVAADSFSPPRWDGASSTELMQVGDLILPDNSRPGRLPVFFEGRLRRFERRIGVVFVTLEAPTAPDRTADGLVPFRGTTAVVVRGPATVRLTFPFQVEPLPGDTGNYWEDLRTPRAQFRLPFGFSPTEPGRSAPSRDHHDLGIAAMPPESAGAPDGEDDACQSIATGEATEELLL